MGNCWGTHVLLTSRSGGPEPLTDPLDDDTYLKRTLGAALLGAREIVGGERYTECIRRLQRSDELIVASCLEAAEVMRWEMFVDDIDSDSDANYNSWEGYLVG